MKIKSFISDCSGNVALSFGLLFIPMSLAAGAAIDISNANYTRTTLQAAADAAALAAGSNQAITDAELQKIVENYARANGAEDVLSSVKSIVGKPNRTTGSYAVTITGKMNTSLMALAGIEDLDVGVLSVVSTGSRALDLALVLDVTGSMEEDIPSGGTRMQALKVSANKLLDIIEKEKATYATLKVGVVPFAEYVNVGMSSGVPVSGDKKDWLGCVGSRAAPADTDATDNGPFPAVIVNKCPSAEILPLSSNFDDARTVIASLSGNGNTYMPAGVFWGTNILTEDAPFNEGMNKQEMEDYRGLKYMIVMTDGKNTIRPSYPLHDIEDQVDEILPYELSQAEKLTELACTNAKSQGIQVFTIAFKIDAPTALQVLNSCATMPSMAFDADDPAQLDGAFTAIGQKLAAISLSQ
jgi:Flp pilus assembly protein TadG